MPTIVRHAAIVVVAAAAYVMCANGVALASNWVAAVRSGSSAQAKAQTAPAAPTPVSAACTSSALKTIKVTWGATTHATGYTVYQSTTSATTGFTAVASG